MDGGKACLITICKDNNIFLMLYLKSVCSYVVGIIKCRINLFNYFFERKDTKSLRRYEFLNFVTSHRSDFAFKIRHYIYPITY